MEEQQKRAQQEKQQQEMIKMLEEKKSKEWPVDFIYHKKIIDGVTWFKCSFENFTRSDDEYIEESNLSGEAIRIFDLMKKMAILTEFARWRCADLHDTCSTARTSTTSTTPGMSCPCFLSLS